jgi:DNA-binding NarL/FixJ family response regulator
MIRIRVIASSPMVRAGLESMLREAPGFVVLGDGVMNSLTARADVQVVESSSLIEGSTRRIGLAGNDAPPTVLLADSIGRSELRRVLHGGVRAVLPRDATAAEIIAAVQAAAAGLIALSSEDMDALLPAEPEQPTTSVPGEPLTSRETQVLGMLAEGMGNKDIASRLKISEHTVKFHVSSILGKLGANTRGEAVARGMREGLVVI